MPQFQIHVAGAKRAGKTTLAKNLIPALAGNGSRPVLVDVDEVKANIFGTETGLPDTAESARFHRWAREVIYNLLVPATIKAGGIPVVVETHSDLSYYLRALDISKRFGTTFKFILLEPPTLKEAGRRASGSAGDHSDMQDFGSEAVRQSFNLSVAKVERAYAGVEGKHICRIPQGTPGEMAEQALRFIFSS